MRQDTPSIANVPEHIAGESVLAQGQPQNGKDERDDCSPLQPVPQYILRMASLLPLALPTLSRAPGFNNEHGLRERSDWLPAKACCDVERLCVSEIR